MDSSVLTDVLGAIVNAASQNFDGVKEHSIGLFYKLLIIEVLLFGIGIALNRIDVQRELVTKILAIGFVQFFLFRYVWLVDNLRDGFVGVGLFAGGNHISIAGFLDPSALIDTGFGKVFAVLDSQSKSWSLFSSLSLVWIFYGLTILVMFVAFAAVGLQIFLAIAEFYLVTTIAIILIPFMAISRTSFIGLRAINGVLAICIKLMVIAFIASLSVPVIENLSFSSADPSIKESISLALGAVAIALLMWRAPSIAMSLISGTGGIDAGSGLISPVLSGSNLVSGAGHILGGVGRSTSKAVSNVKKATSIGG